MSKSQKKRVYVNLLKNDFIAFPIQNEYLLHATIRSMRSFKHSETPTVSVNNLACTMFLLCMIKYQCSVPGDYSRHYKDIALQNLDQTLEMVEHWLAGKYGFRGIMLESTRTQSLFLKNPDDILLLSFF